MLRTRSTPYGAQSSDGQPLVREIAKSRRLDRESEVKDMSTLTINQTEVRKGFRVRWRFVVAFLVMVPVVAHLFFAVTHSPFANYYDTVDEVIARGDATSRVRVGGPVVPGSITWDKPTRTLTFQLQGEGRVLPVTYRGFAPDTFRDGATAIVEGELTRDGKFNAYNVLVKCPHQYVAG